MRYFKGEKGFADFLMMIVMAVIGLFSFIILGQHKEEQIYEAISDYYNEHEVDTVEKSVIGQDEWDRKVVFSNGDVKYVNVECNEEKSESIKDMECEIQEAEVINEKYKKTEEIYSSN